jgi:TPR repeat protein
MIIIKRSRYKKAASQGLALAQYNLGYCYENGEGIEKNNDIALYW